MTQPIFPASMSAIIRWKAGRLKLWPVYDVIFLGYPVWANSVPRAVLTFLETHDFSGKVIIPFCTHNGYGPGKSVEEIRLACDEAQILAGFDISSEQMQTAEDAVTSWLEEVWNALPQ